MPTTNVRVPRRGSGTGRNPVEVYRKFTIRDCRSGSIREHSGGQEPVIIN